jgi:O-antigen/teichoic acid export membrane protein
MIKTISRKLGVNKLKDRSKVVATNAAISLLLKGFSIAISFVFVPLYLNSIGQRQYGIILTITSISNFISFFDIGIGNGLRSKLGKALADGDTVLGRQYVSTSYFYVSIFFCCVFLVYCAVSPFIHWFKVLNISINEIHQLNTWVFVVITLFVIRFILQLIGPILLADQKSFINDSIQFSTSLITIICCFALKALGYLNFYSLLIITCAAPIVVLILYSVTLFTTKYKMLVPSVSYVNHGIRKDLLSLGFKFFIIQIVALIIFSTTNILIAQLFNIAEVTRYNIAYKYFNITVIVFSILMSPLWGAFTHAWHQNDKKWISKNVKYYALLALAFSVVNILQFFIYPFFIRIWLKQDLPITTLLVAGFILYNFVYCYNNICSHFLASIGEINRQVYAAVLGGALNIPLTIYLAKYTSFGLAAILFANIICLLPSTLITTIHTIQLLKNKAE